MPSVSSLPRLGAPTRADAIGRLRQAALARALDEPDPLRLLGPLRSPDLPGGPGEVDRVVDAVVAEAAHHLLTHGWTPAEVHAFAARRLDPLSLTFLVDVLSAAVRWMPPPAGHCGKDRHPGTVWWTSARPHVTQWTERHGCRRSETLRVVVDVLALLAHVPRTDRPQPGMPPAPAAALAAATIDPRTARLVDALLERAAATEYPAEAAACTARARELLRRSTPTPTAAAPGRIPAGVVARARRTLRVPGRHRGPRAR